MNTIEREVRYLGATNCFVYCGGSYIPSNYSVQCKLSQSLPTVAAKYEQLLIDNNIAYNKLDDGDCEIYDKDCYEYEKLTLPVYVFHAVKKVYVNTEKVHTELVSTKESIQAASFVFNGKVSNLIFEANAKEFAQKVKALLGKNAIAFLPASSPLIQELEKFRSELCEKNRYFITARFAREGFGRYFGYVIVDLQKVKDQKVSVFDMDVPEHLVGLTIGAGGQNIKDLINDINRYNSVNINHINVHKIAS